MRIAKVIERNRQMKAIARKATRRVEQAVVHSIDGDRVNIRLNNSPTLVRHVEVAGDIGALRPNIEVAIIWKENRPVVLAGQPSMLSGVGSEINQPLSDISARVIRTSNQAASGSVTTPTAITFDTALYDTCKMFDINYPTQVNIKVDGMYLLVGAVQFVNNGAVSHTAAAILLNGAINIAHASGYTSSTTYDPKLSLASLVRLRAGDFVELLTGAAHATAYVDDFSPTLTVVRLYE